ncbi:hypothetical protein BFW01_g4434 [Lasiodiplodia theobromae]|nr:hypothetical protein BFW01_g4434 [Lasiodiplodia theobromae]
MKYCNPDCLSKKKKVANNFGQYVDAQSEESFPLYNPADESLLHPAIQAAGPADIDAAVAGAQAA